MEFGGFTPHQSSASIPVREEESNVSIGEMDFFRQYNRNAQGSVSTFLPPDDGDHVQQMRPSATSSFHEQSVSQDNQDPVWGVGEERLGSLVQERLHDYHPEHVQVRTPPNPSMSQGYMSYDSSINQSVLDTSDRQSPYAIAHGDNVLAGNLSQQPLPGKKYPKIPAKPKTKTKKSRKKSADVDSPSTQSNTSGAVEPSREAPTYENLSSMQSPSEQLQGGYHPDHNSSAILYAPDGTMFSLPMNGEFNPSLVLGTPTDRESTNSHSEQHSFAIMPNESINLSHGENIQPTLSVFGEEIDIDTPVINEKKVVKKIKKRTKSTDIDRVTTTLEDITSPSHINVSAQREHLDLSRGSYENRSLPPVPREHEPHNVYEDIRLPSTEYQHMEYSSTNTTVDNELSHVSRPQHLDLQSSSRSMQVDQHRQLNTSQHSESIYNPACAQGSVSMYDFDQDNHSFSVPSGSSMQSLPISPVSPDKVKKIRGRRTRITKDNEQASLPRNVDIMGGHYMPMDGQGPVRSVEADIYEDVHIAGGRRPTGPPPPPPPASYISSPPSEEPPPVPTSSLPSSPQLTMQPISLAQYQETDIDIPIPMTTDIIPSPHDNSLGLDSSVPAATGDAASQMVLRKSSHRKLEGSTPVTDGSSSPKKPKVAKKPKHLKQKSFEDAEIGLLSFQQEQMDTREQILPEQPYETNIDDVFQPHSANLQQSMDTSTSREKKTRRVKKKSRSRDFLDQSAPMQEIWIDGMPDTPSVNELSTDAQFQQQDELISSSIIASCPSASTPKPTKKKKTSRTASDNSTSSYLGDVQVVNIDINTTDVSGTRSFHETDIDADMNFNRDVPFNPTPVMEFGAADVQPTKAKVVKKKKKIAKSVGDISELRGQDLQIVPVSPFETDIDGVPFATETIIDDVDAPKKKTTKKKKKLNKSTGDLTAQLTNDVVNIDIDGSPAQEIKPKKKKKKKLAKSVGDLSQTLPADVRMVAIDDSVQPDSFYEVQTLERPKRKVKRVKKKLTKSMGDLTAEETQQMTVIDINIDGNHTHRDIAVDGTVPGNFTEERVTPLKKKKKKLAKSLSDDLLLDTAPTDGMHIVRETCIDDVMPEATNIEDTTAGTVVPMDVVKLVKKKKKKLTKSFSDDLLLDTTPTDTSNILRETCIDDVMPDATYIQHPDNIAAGTVAAQDGVKSVKKKKKKPTKSLSDDLLLDTTPTDTANTLRETYIDDVMSDATYIQHTDNIVAGTVAAKDGVTSVKKKKKKLTKSLSDDLLLDTTPTDTTNTLRETCIDDVMPDAEYIQHTDNIGEGTVLAMEGITPVKRKKKKGAKSLSDDLIHNTTPTDMLHISQEEHIDDIVLDIANTRDIDVIQDIQDEEMTTDNVQSNIEISAQRDEHVYANIQGAEHSFASVPSHNTDYNQTEYPPTGIDGLLGSQIQTMASTVTQEIAEDMQLSYSGSGIDAGVPPMISHEHITDDVMQTNLVVDSQNTNIHHQTDTLAQQWSMRDERLQTDFEPGPLTEPEYVNITQINQSGYEDSIPPTPHKADFTGEIISSGPQMIDIPQVKIQTLADQPNIYHSQQDTSFRGKESTIDEVFDDTRVTLSPQEDQCISSVMSDTPTETRKKRKKRSKSADRAMILTRDTFYGDPEASMEIKKVKKKKKLNKSTGDLAASGVVLVDIDIESTPRPISGGDQDCQMDETTPKKVRKVKKKKLTKSVDDVTNTGITDESSMNTMNVEMSATDVDMIVPDSEKKEKKRVVKKKLNKSTGDIHILSEGLIPALETKNIDDIMITNVDSLGGRDEQAEMDGTNVAKKKKRKATRNKLSKSTSEMPDIELQVYKQSDIDEVASVEHTSMEINGNQLHEEDHVLQGHEYIEELIAQKTKTPPQMSPMYYGDRSSPVVEQSEHVNNDIMVDLIPVEGSMDTDFGHTLTSTPEIIPQETGTGKKERRKKKSIKSMSDLTDMSSTGMIFGQETNVDDLPAVSSELTGETSVIDDNPVISEKKTKKVVKKPKKKSVSDLSATYGIDDTQALSEGVDDLRMNGTYTHDPVPVSPNVEGEIVIPDHARVDTEKKKKIIKKKPKAKTVGDLLDVKISKEAPFQETNVDELLINETGAQSTMPAASWPNQMDVDASDVLPTFSNTTNTKMPGDTHKSDGYIQTQMMDATESQAVTKKKKKIVKKKINKSVGDLSDVGTSVGLTRDILIDDATTNSHDLIATDTVMSGDRENIPKKKKKVVKKKRTKSVGDLSNISAVLETTDIVIEGEQDAARVGNATPNVPKVTLDDGLMMDVEPNQQNLNEQIPSYERNIGDVEQLEMPGVMLRPLDGTEFEIKDAINEDILVRHSPKETSVDDLFLDQKTMSTVLGDVLMRPDFTKDHSPASNKMETTTDPLSESHFLQESYVDDVMTLSGSVEEQRITDERTIQMPEMKTKKKAVKKKKLNKSTSDINADGLSVASQNINIDDGFISVVDDKSAPITESATLGREKKKRIVKKKKLNKSLSDITDINLETFTTGAGVEIDLNQGPLDIRDIPLIDDADDAQLDLTPKRKTKSKRKQVSKIQVIPDDVEQEHITETAVELEVNVPQAQQVPNGDRSIPVILDIAQAADMGPPKKKVVKKKKKSESSEIQTTEPNNNEVHDVVQHLSDNDSPMQGEISKPKEVKSKTQEDVIKESNQYAYKDIVLQPTPVPVAKVYPEHDNNVDMAQKQDNEFELTYAPTEKEQLVPVRPNIVISKADAPQIETVELPKTMSYIPPQPTPTRVDRKKEYPTVKYKPWTDILFSPTESKIKITKKGSYSLDNSVDNSFDISLGEKLNSTLPALDQSTDTTANIAPPVSYKSPAGNQKENGPSLERTPSLRSQAKSLDNLVDAADAEVLSYSLQTYNAYDDDQERERKQERARTKSVDNLTLLQQRKRLVGSDKTMESKREHSKSTGCLLEGRLGKLWRRTLTQEVVYETTTTREEVIIIKRPTVFESNELEPPAEKDNSNKKERRYMGSLMIVDIYDDTNSDDDSKKESSVDDDISNLSFQQVDSPTEAVVSNTADTSRAVTNVLLENGEHLKAHDMTTTNTNVEVVATEQRDKLRGNEPTDVIITNITETIVMVGVDEKPPPQDVSDVILVEAKEIPTNVQTIHFETLGVSMASELKPTILMESPVVISTNTYTIQTDLKANLVGQTTLETNDVNLSKDEGIQVCLDDVQAPPSQSLCDVEDKDFDEDSSGTETDGESGESYDAADDNWDQQPEDDSSHEQQHIESVLEAIDEEESEADIQDDLAESLHTTTITITDEITTIESSRAADSDVTVGIQRVDAGNDPSDSGQKYITTAHLSDLAESNMRDTQQEQSSTTSTTVSHTMTEIAFGTNATHHKVESEIPVMKVTTYEDIPIQEELESSIIYSESDSSQEEVDVIPPSADGGFTESWEEVVTYEYEFDKDTGVKRIVLKPKILDVADKQVFHSVENSSPSPVKRQEKKDLKQLPEIEGDSLVVYEYGEMISMYSDTSNADIYLNNSLELGTSGAEGACAGVERAIDIMVSQELHKAIDEVSGQSDGEVSSTKPLTTTEVIDSESFNQEPLPSDRQYAATFSQSVSDYPTSDNQTSVTTANADDNTNAQSDLEIDLSQMTPNLKRAVELLRDKYNIAKMSREATPIPPELADASQIPEGYIMNNDSLPESANLHMDDDIMEQVQEELETVMDELSKMELFTSADLQSKDDDSSDHTETRTERSNSNSSDADTLVGASTDLAQAETLDGSDDDDDDEGDSSGEQMIFGMDDVFVKVVTTKDGRIKKIKILEGKEGGDTKKIVNPEHEQLPPDQAYGTSDAGEPAMFQDQRYFTRQFYQDDFFEGDDQYHSGSESDDPDSVIEMTEQRTPTSTQYAVGDEIEVVQRSQHAYSNDGSERHPRDIPGHAAVRGSPDYTHILPESPYHGMEHFDGDLNHDESTDSESSDDDYYEGDEHESPMRSLSPIAEEAEAQSTRGSTPVLTLPTRQCVTDSSEEDDDEVASSSEQPENVEYKQYGTRRHSESDDDDLEVLKELVRTEQSTQSVGHVPHEEGEEAHPALPQKSSSGHTQDDRQSPRRDATADNDGTSDVKPRDVRPRDVAPRDIPSNPPVDAETDIMAQKLALEGFLSSLGMALFLILAAIIFHMIRQYIGDEV